MRDYEDSVKEMKKENFNLKLKIFFLEERLAVGKENRNVGLLADNIDLKVNIEYLKYKERQRIYAKSSLFCLIIANGPCPPSYTDNIIKLVNHSQ